MVSQEHELEEEIVPETSSSQELNAPETAKPVSWEDRPEDEKDITLGTKLHKEFPGHGSFTGTITGINTLEKGETTRFTYKVTYEDGDKEELFADEVRPLVQKYQEL